MRIPRVTIKGLLIAVAVVAVDCYLVVEVFNGVLLPAIGLNVGLARILRREGLGRRFWVAFEVTGLLTLGIYVWLLGIFEEVAADWPITVLNGLPPAAQAVLVPWLEDSYLGMICLVIVVFEATIGLPLLLFSALVGEVVSRIMPGPVARPGSVERLMPPPGPNEALTVPSPRAPKS